LRRTNMTSGVFGASPFGFPSRAFVRSASPSCMPWSSASTPSSMAPTSFGHRRGQERCTIGWPLSRPCVRNAWSQPPAGRWYGLYRGCKRAGVGCSAERGRKWNSEKRPSGKGPRQNACLQPSATRLLTRRPRLNRRRANRRHVARIFATSWRRSRNPPRRPTCNAPTCLCHHHHPPAGAFDDFSARSVAGSDWHAVGPVSQDG